MYDEKERAIVSTATVRLIPGTKAGQSEDNTNHNDSIRNTYDDEWVPYIAWNLRVVISLMIIRHFVRDERYA